MVRPDHFARNCTITQRVLAGEYCRVVAQEYGLSRNRIEQIVKAVCMQVNPEYYAHHWGPSLWQLRDDRQQFGLGDGPC